MTATKKTSPKRRKPIVRQIKVGQYIVYQVVMLGIRGGEYCSHYSTWDEAMAWANSLARDEAFGTMNRPARIPKKNVKP